MLFGQFPISNHLKDLPYTSTFEMSPDAQLVGYLSQHTTHAILQAKPEIDALMAKRGAPVEPPQRACPRNYPSLHYYIR